MRFFVSLTLGILLIACQAKAGDGTELRTEKERVSYSIGVSMARNLQRQSIDVVPEATARGLMDALKGGKTALSDDEMRDILTAFQKKLLASREQRRKEEAEKNRKEGMAFLAENGKKEGIVTLKSGLQYRIIKKGTGRRPKATDRVVVHYRGTLIDGTEFDSSYKRGKPATFAVKGVIKGWTEALQLMRKGAKWQLFIPPELAYGERGAGSLIGPNSVLIFEVELLDIK